jgi:probable F420-dependent oxidoreductase
MGNEREFRFGVLANGARDLAMWQETAATAEALGYSSFLVPDHMGQEWAPAVALALAAGVTSRVKLGPLMLSVALRTPSVLYKELATLAQLAGSRLEIGLGAGWLSSDFTRAGVPMESPAERIARLGEAITVVKALWHEERVTFHGRYYDITDAPGRLVSPSPGPAWVVGGGGRKVLSVAAEHADIVSLGATLSQSGKGSAFGASAVIQEFDKRVQWVAERAGPRISDIEFQVLAQVCAVTPDAQRYASRVLTRMFGLQADDALESPLTLVGSAAEICDKVQRLRDRLGVSYWVIPAAQMRPFADVVVQLAGK